MWTWQLIAEQAAVSPLVALLISDLVREVLYRNGLAQQWGISSGMWVVYGTTALMVLMGPLAYGTRSPFIIAEPHWLAHARSSS